MEQEEIIDAVRDWLDNDDWHYDFDAERTMIKTGINLKSKIKSSRILIDIKENSYIVYLISPINGDKENPAEIIKYLTMANYGLINGNFEFDVRDGEIRYKTFVNCEGLESLSEEVIRDSVYVGCAMMDRYGDGIASLAFGYSDAETEIKKAEERLNSRAADEDSDSES